MEAGSCIGGVQDRRADEFYFFGGVKRGAMMKLWFSSV
jgi:hypothetical protein